MRLIPLLILNLALGGCVGTLVDVATAPVRVAGKAVDVATTSQSEADEKRGRELRRREERYGELSRKHERESRRCNDGNAQACAKADTLAVELGALRPGLPVEPD